MEIVISILVGLVLIYTIVELYTYNKIYIVIQYYDNEIKEFGPFSDEETASIWLREYHKNNLISHFRLRYRKY